MNEGEKTRLATLEEEVRWALDNLDGLSTLIFNAARMRISALNPKSPIASMKSLPVPSVSIFRLWRSGVIIYQNPKREDYRFALSEEDRDEVIDYEGNLSDRAFGWGCDVLLVVANRIPSKEGLERLTATAMALSFDDDTDMLRKIAEDRFKWEKADSNDNRDYVDMLNAFCLNGGRRR